MTFTEENALCDRIVEICREEVLGVRERVRLRVMAEFGMAVADLHCTQSVQISPFPRRELPSHPLSMLGPGSRIGMDVSRRLQTFVLDIITFVWPMPYEPIVETKTK
jgi:hypothetical protein